MEAKTVQGFEIEWLFLLMYGHYMILTRIVFLGGHRGVDMEEVLQVAQPYLLFAALWAVLLILWYAKQIAQRLEAQEADQIWKVGLRDEQVEQLRSDVLETKELLKDLIDFQRGKGRYRFDANDSMLPANIRDQTGRED